MKRRWGMIHVLISLMGMSGCLAAGEESPTEKTAPAISDRARTESVKTLTERAVTETQLPLAALAHTLGFGWCGGCRAPSVGGDLYRTNQSNGTITIASNTSDCPDDNKGYMWDQRLSMDY